MKEFYCIKYTQQMYGDKQENKFVFTNMDILYNNMMQFQTIK